MEYIDQAEQIQNLTLALLLHSHDHICDHEDGTFDHVVGVFKKVRYHLLG